MTAEVNVLIFGEAGRGYSIKGIYTRMSTAIQAAESLMDKYNFSPDYTWKKTEENSQMTEWSDVDRETGRGSDYVRILIVEVDKSFSPSPILFQPDTTS